MKLQQYVITWNRDQPLGDLALYLDDESGDRRHVGDYYEYARAHIFAIITSPTRRHARAVADLLQLMLP